MIRWFGKRPPPMSEVEHVPTPVGEPCSYCRDQIADGDEGYLVPYLSRDSASMLPSHLSCFLRQIVGSVGHQLGTCPCHGGSDEDPSGMSKRQAAEAAVRLYESRQSQNLN